MLLYRVEVPLLSNRVQVYCGLQGLPFHIDMDLDSLLANVLEAHGQDFGSH